MLPIFIFSIVFLLLLTILLMVSAGSENSLGVDPDAAFVVKVMYVFLICVAVVSFLAM